MSEHVPEPQFIKDWRQHPRGTYLIGRSKDRTTAVDLEGALRYFEKLRERIENLEARVAQSHAQSSAFTSAQSDEIDRRIQEAIDFMNSSE